jgi:hypothetical protein
MLQRRLQFSPAADVAAGDAYRRRSIIAISTQCERENLRKAIRKRHGNAAVRLPDFAYDGKESRCSRHIRASVRSRHTNA